MAAKAPIADLLDPLYGAALDPALWPATLERFADLVNADAVNLSRLDVVTGEGWARTARVDPAVVDDYFAYFAQRNPLLAVQDLAEYRNGWSPSILTDEDWMAREQFTRSEYFNDFMRPIDSNWLMMVRVALHGPEIVSLALGRRDGKGRFGEAERDLVSAIQPHLIRAYTLGHRLAEAGALGGALSKGMDRAALGLLVLDADGCVRHANAAAERVLRAGRSLLIVAGRLTAVEPSAAQRLERFIRIAASPVDGLRRGGDLVFSAPELGARLTITLVPLQPDSFALLSARPGVLVTLSGPDLDPEQPDGVVAKLTIRERDCLTLVARGKSDWEISVILGLSEATARFHVDNARKKLHASNRAHAVAKLAAAGGLVAAQL